MIVLGIDPGTAETGYGLIECQSKTIKLVKHGVIKTSVNDAAPQRLQVIYKEMLALLTNYRPKVLAIESLFFNLNAKSASAVAQAIGVTKLAAAKKKILVCDYPPLKIKKVLIGKGRAKKKQVQEGVKKILKMEKVPRPTHASDALAVAICHWWENGGKMKAKAK